MNEVIVDKVEGGVRIVEVGAPEGSTMTRYARVADGVVTNVVESHIDPDGVGSEWIACGNAGPGWLYDGVVFSAPPVPTPVATPWTKKEFLLKFTPAEYAAIAAATKTNAVLDYYWQLFMVAENVLKTDPATIDGINALEGAGLLAAGRAAEILA